MNNIPEKAIEAAAKAMYKFQVQRAQETIEKTKFSISELPEIMSRIAKEFETAQVLVFASYLESKIDQLISYQLRRDIKRSEYSNIFTGLGPLSTFSGKIALAYQLRWLEKSTKLKLDIFRKIRNDFAHSAYKTSYQDDKIRSWFAAVEGNLGDFIERVGPIMREKSSMDIKRMSEISITEKYMCWLAMLARDVCMELLVLPVCVQDGVDPTDVTRTSTAPDVINNVTGAMIEAIYVLAGSKVQPEADASASSHF